MERRLFGVWIFDVGARLYTAMTANAVWQASCASLLDHVPANQKQLQALDLGTGPAVSALAMSRKRADVSFIGFDLSQRMLAIAKGHGTAAGWLPQRLSLLRGDALRLPLTDGRVDVVTGHSFLYLLPDHKAALAEANRVLARGGYAAFLEPHAGPVSWSWLIEQRSWRLLESLALWRFYSGRHMRFSPASLSTALAEAGFTNITTEITLGGFGIFGRAQKS
jgi:ubiquinone/menaquinone biosynthesis C-methylase UbiE